MKYAIEIYSYSVDSLSFSRIDIIETFKDLRFFNRLNGIGTCTFRLSVQDLKANAVNLIRFKNYIVVKREGVIVWFGPISKISGTYSDVKGDLSVECNTALYTLKTRFTDKLTQYTNVQQCQIANNLIGLAQSRTNGGLGIITGSNPTSVTRDRTYEYGNIAEAIIDLSSVIDGFDFMFDPIQNTTGELIGIEFNCYYPSIGSLREDLQPLTVGTNIHSLEFRTDGNLENSGIALGAGTGDVLTATLDYGAAQKAYTRREVIKSEKDISVASTLSLKLESDLNKSSVENFLIDVTMKEGTPPTFGQYSIGDILLIDIDIPNSSYFSFSGQGRVEEIAVSVDNQGAETITPKLSVIP